MPPFGPLSIALRAALAPQARRLGKHTRDALWRAARLTLTPEETEAEEAINRLRERLGASADRLRVQDFGAGTRASALAAETQPGERAVGEIYRRAAVGPAWGRFLFTLTREKKPHRVLELGTNLGVSAAHLAKALQLNGGEGRLVTLEGDSSLAEHARAHLSDLGLAERVTVVTGRFDDTLSGVLEAQGPFDLVFLDGHHEEAATRRYFGQIAPHLAPGAWVLFDDVEPTRPVRRAWRAIVEEQLEAGAVYLGKWGLLVWPEAAGEEPPPPRRVPGAQDAQ